MNGDKQYQTKPRGQRLGHLYNGQSMSHAGREALLRRERIPVILGQHKSRRAHESYFPAARALSVTTEAAGHKTKQYWDLFIPRSKIPYIHEADGRHPQWQCLEGTCAMAPSHSQLTTHLLTMSAKCSQVEFAAK